MAQFARVTGDRKLVRLIRRARDRETIRALRKGMNAGLKVVQKAIQTEAPRSGRKSRRNADGKRLLPLHRSIGSRFRRNSKTGEVVAMSGVAVKKKRAVVARHAHLIVLGTRNRRTKKGANRGRVAPNPFVDRAFSRVQAQAQTTVLSATQSELQKALRS